MVFSHRSVFRMVALVAMMSGYQSARCQNPYVVEYLGFSEGLPSLNITAVAQDRQGMMWLAAYSTGLIRYDGVTFKVFNMSPESVPALSDNTLEDLVLDHQGRLWIAYGTGIEILDPHSLQIIRNITLPGKDASTREVTSLYVDPNGDIWAVMPNEGIVRFSGGDPTQITQMEKPVPYPRYINQAANGQLWCMGEEEISIWKNGRFVILNNSLPGRPNGTISLKPIENQDGLLTGVVLHMPNGTVKIYQLNLQTNDFEPGMAADGITALSSVDISRRILEVASPLTKAPLFGQPFKTFKDIQGIIWVAPGYGGLFKMKAREMDFTFCPDLKGVSLRGMIEAPDGSLYIASYNGIFQYFPGTNRARRLGKRADIFHLAQYRDQTLLTFSDGSGIDQLRLPLPRPFRSLPVVGQDLQYFTSLALDDGWILAGNQQIFRLHPADWRVEALDTLPTDPSVRTFCFTRAGDGRIWIGTSNGVYVLSKDGHCEAPALRQDKRLGEKSKINNIFEDSAGRLWFATRLYGLLCYDPRQQRVQAFDQTSGFASNETYAILPSHNGSVLWVSTFAGLECIQLDDNNIRLFSESDGTSGNEFNTGSYLRTRSGDLYFGGVKGLTRFSPSRFQPTVAPPPAPFISEVNIEDVSSNVIAHLNYPAADTVLQLSHGQNTLEFRFGSTNYFRTTAKVFYVQLEGLDQNWIPLGAVNNIKYYRLPAGYYTFKVKCNSNSGQANDEIYTVSFEIDQVYYKKWWFISLLTGFGILLIWLAFQFRLHQISREQALRHRIAADLHDDLGSNLSSISNLIHVINRRNQGGKSIEIELQRLLEQSRTAHSAMSDIIWAISSSNQDTNDLVRRMEDYADKWLKAANVAVVFETTIENPKQQIAFFIKHQLLLTYKEMLGNVLKHTFAEAVRIQFSVGQEKNIQLVVHSTFSERKPDVPSSGRGLAGIRERIERLGGTVEVKEEEYVFEVRIGIGK